MTGQNLVTSRVIEYQADHISRTYAYPSGGGFSILRAIWLGILLCINVLLTKHNAIYVVCSRSSFGFLRDVLPLGMSLFGRRVIVHVHGSDFPELFRRRVLGRLALFLYRKCEIIIPSTHLMPRLAEFHFAAIKVCENFSSLPFEFQPIDSKLSLSKNNFTVLWNSNQMASKGLRELVGGLRHLRADGFKIQLVILGNAVGDSEASKKDISAFVSSLVSDDWIYVKGSVQQTEVAGFLEICDLVALPSTYESECQPLSVIQGMLWGRTILITPTAALRTTVGTYPAIFAARNELAIADALRPYVAGEKLSNDLIQKEVEIARERFSPIAFDQRMKGIFTFSGAK